MIILYHAKKVITLDILISEIWQSRMIKLQIQFKFRTAYFWFIIEIKIDKWNRVTSLSSLFNVVVFTGEGIVTVSKYFFF